MPANYTKTAWFYDALSRVVFGNTLVKAQRHFLNTIPAGSNVLIIGGGTGKILEDVAALHPQGLYITYIELAEAMIAKARKRNYSGNTVNFVNSAAEDTVMPVQADVIITAFLLDNYTAQTLPACIDKLGLSLKSGGLWLNTDFKLTGKWWQPLLMKSMYRFFKLFAHIPAKSLPDINGEFKRAGYNLIDHRSFYGSFVETQVWRK